MDYATYCARMGAHQHAIKEAASLLLNALEAARTDANAFLKPILSTEIGHATEIVQAMEMGILVPPQSVVEG